jgi:murein DD-endopeptidase MepM/ murein hydrolase activator NlpD
MRRSVLVFLIFPSLAFCGARVDIGAGPRFPGTALTIRFYPSPESLSPSASAFKQTADFYAADTQTAVAMDYAIVAIPLQTKAGSYPLKVQWTEAGLLQSASFRIRVLRRPGKIVTVHLPEKATKAVGFLSQDKPLMEAAFLRSSGPPLWRGYFLKPVPATRLSEAFGVERRYMPLGATWRHKGLDMPVPSGTPVKAANDAVVVLAREGLKAYGGLVVLSHGYGLCSSYMHLSKVMVREGEIVAKGAVIALSGSEGIATGAHLHWQMNLRGFAIDPSPWMDKETLAALK